MKALLYPLYAVFSIVATILSYFAVLVACLFIDENGNLKYLRGWLQTTDNPATGDPVFWSQQYPNLSRYWLAVLWLWRNPSQGFDQKLAAKVAMQTPIKVWWRSGDNYLYSCDGYFHLSYRLGLATGGIGWRLNNIVEGYPHETMGQLVTTILRFHR
jgi:hypothetical protein